MALFCKKKNNHSARAHTHKYTEADSFVESDGDATRVMEPANIKHLVDRFALFYASFPIAPELRNPVVVLGEFVFLSCENV